MQLLQRKIKTLTNCQPRPWSAVECECSYEEKTAVEAPGTLHAREIHLRHPATNRKLLLKVDPPEDMMRVVSIMS
ncbi:MAG: hypothetical protein R6V06_05995 [Kiritimatiellia bacterium]